MDISPYGFKSRPGYNDKRLILNKFQSLSYLKKTRKIRQLMERNILVFGATGNTGLEICKKLEEDKILHSAFVRESSKDKIKSKQTTIFTGNVLNIEDVRKVVSANQFTEVVIALGSRDLNGVPVRSTGTKNIVDSLNELSLKTSLHVISAHGIGNSWYKLGWFEKLISKLLIGKTMRDHSLQEEYVKSYSRKTHVIRPVALKNNPRTGKVFSQDDSKLPNKDISRADLASYVVESIKEERTGINSVCRG